MSDTEENIELNGDLNKTFKLLVLEFRGMRKDLKRVEDNVTELRTEIRSDIRLFASDVAEEQAKQNKQILSNKKKLLTYPNVPRAYSPKPSKSIKTL